MQQGNGSISKYFQAADMEQLRSDGKTISNVIGGISLLIAGAQMAGNAQAVEEMKGMIEALEHVRAHINRVADDYDPLMQKGK